MLGAAFDRMAEAVERARKTQRDFLANVSHELKTPLTSLIGFSQALVDGSLWSENERTRAATIIHEESERVLRMAQELLDLARVEAGSISLHITAVDLAGQLEQELEMIRPRAKKRRLELNVAKPTNIAPVAADPERLHQVIDNLLDNAVKYAPEGTAIKISTLSNVSGVEVIVANSTGAYKPDSERIFERFYRADPSRSAAAGGCGTGRIRSVEPLEYALGIRLVCARRVGHDHLHARDVRQRRDLDRSPFGRVLDRVVKQVVDDLVEAFGVGRHRREVRGLGDVQLEPALFGTGPDHLELLLELPCEVHRRDVQGDRARLHPRQVEELLRHAKDTLGFLVDDRRRPSALVLAPQAAVDQRLAEADQACQGRLQLVRHVGEEVALRLSRALDRLRHAVESRTQHPDLVTPSDPDAARVVARRNVLRRARELRERTRERAADKEDEEHGGHERGPTRFEQSPRQVAGGG